jgi:hypothetical protein
MAAIQKAKNKYKIIGFAGLIISVILLFCFSDMVELIINFLKKYLSSDHYLEPLTIDRIKLLFVIFVITSITLSLFSLLNISRKVKDIAHNLIDMNSAFSIS